MRLAALVAGLDVAASAAGTATDLATAADPDVSGIVHDSRRAAPGDLFVAWQGEHFDGTAFAAGAVDAGAVAVVAPHGSTRPAGVAAPCPGSPPPIRTACWRRSPPASTAIRTASC